MNRAHTLLPRGIVISLVPVRHGPVPGDAVLAALVHAAEEGGASGSLVDGVERLRFVKRLTTLPLIGRGVRTGGEGAPAGANPAAEARALVEAGADLVQVDGMPQSGRDPVPAASLIAAIRAEVNVPCIAAVSSPDEGLAASEAGAELFSTTAGAALTVRKVRPDVPDLDLVEQLSQALPDRVLAEGRFWTPEQASLALKLGAWGVILDDVVSSPLAVVKRFSAAVRPTLN